VYVSASICDLPIPDGNKFIVARRPRGGLSSWISSEND
jgi:hypothetical protein